jgi:hypothetical protein
MEEGRRLRQIVHEQFRDARVVGDEGLEQQSERVILVRS